MNFVKLAKMVTQRGQGPKPQSLLLTEHNSSSASYFKHCAAAQRPWAQKPRFVTQNTLKIKNFMILANPGVPQPNFGLFRKSLIDWQRGGRPSHEIEANTIQSVIIHCIGVYKELIFLLENIFRNFVPKSQI